MLEYIKEYCPQKKLLLADGFDDAILGIDFNTYRVIYSVSKCIKILMEGGMDDSEALEYFDFNVKDAYMGERTPIWCDDDFNN